MNLRSACILSAIALLCAFVLTALLESGCAMSHRAAARGTLLAVAQAAKTLDDQCASVALAEKDVELARRCETSYKATRRDLISAGLMVDAWEDDVEREELTCIVARVGAELGAIAHDLEKRGRRLMPLVADARELALTLGICHEARP